MASTLSFSDFVTDNKIENFTTKKRKNRTIKKKSNKVTEFLNSMDDNENKDDGSGLANFEPLAPGVLTKQPDEKKENISNTDSAVNPEGFSKLDTNEAANLNYQNYYNTYVPYYSKASNEANIHGSKDDLMKKLNYMIHLLEENKDEKTQNVTEELVLYMFLGVFTIFVVDSFARAGKYTR
jgi:hypothetical protein